MSDFTTPAASLERFIRTIETKTVTCDIHQKEYQQQRLLIVITKKEILTDCPICEAIRSDEESHRLVKEHADRCAKEYHDNLTRRLFGQSMIPPRFTGKTFDNFIATEDSAGNLNKMRTFAENIKFNIEHGLGLILFGNKGTGKSHLSCAVAEAAIQQHHSALFITADDIIDDVKSGFTENSSSKAKINMYTRPDLLIIDEIVAGIDDKGTRTLAKILNQRYSQKRSTFIITNLAMVADKDNPITLSTLIGERIIDRLRETNKALKFTGESFRKHE